jgi:uncharacterized protein DUF4242
MTTSLNRQIFPFRRLTPPPARGKVNPRQKNISGGVTFAEVSAATGPSQIDRQVPMPKFVIEREIPGLGNLSESELRAISQKSVGILKGMGPEIQWLHSYVTGDKLYCVYLAPDEATVKEHAKRGGFPANRISAVRRLIDPTTAE